MDKHLQAARAKLEQDRIRAAADYRALCRQQLFDAEFVRMVGHLVDLHRTASVIVALADLEV